MFFYSERPGTLAAKKLEDDIPMEVKKRRLAEIVAKQREHSLYRNQLEVGKVHKVLIEGPSRRSEDQLQGRTSSNKVVIFDKGIHQKGQYVNVLVNECSSATLFGAVIEE